MGINMQVLESLIKDNWNKIWYMSSHYYKTHEDRDDLIQETMAKVLSNFDKFELNTNFTSWTWVIMRNTFINQYRKSANSKTHLEFDEKYHGAAEALIENLSISDELSHALSGLSRDGREILQKVALFDYSYREVSQELRIPEGTVMSKLFRARNKCKLCLADYAAENYNIGLR